MEKHPQITLDRIARFVEELQQQLWVEQQPLQISVYQCADPIPHDDAIRQTYTPVGIGFTWGPKWSTAWFHLQGSYPEEWTGHAVALLMDTSSEALVWQDGAPAQGLDANRRDFVIAAPATGAGTIDMYVEAAANDHFGNGDTFTLRTAHLSHLNKPAWDLYHDLRILLDLTKNLPEDSSRRARLLTALNAAVNAYRRQGDAGIAEAREILAVEYAQPACPSATTVNAIGHSHIDVAWLWPLRETVRKCARTFSSALKYMEEYPDYHFVQSQAQLYAFTKEHYPELYARIKQAVADGRWEPQGSMWVEADCNLSSGESLVRQILYGKKFFREEFGLDTEALWLPDVFGYSAALPQILQGCGISYFITAKIAWNQTNKFPHHTFWWEGIDGTRIFAKFLVDGNYNGAMTPQDVLYREKLYSDKGRSDSWLYAYGHGDGGGGVTKEMLEAYPRMRNLEGLPKLTQQLVRDYLPAMAAEAHDLRTWAGELYLELHRGTYTTQAKNKWENRHCEFLLRDAECLAALHPNGLAAYPADELEQAWKLVLLNQFHDIIPGSSIHWVYEDSAKDYATVHHLGDAVVADGLQAFAQRIDTEKLKHPVMVWNTLGFARSGLVNVPWDGDDAVVALSPKNQPSRTQRIDEHGERRLLVEVVDVPSIGYSTYDLLEGEMPEEVIPAVTDVVSVSDRVLENDLVRLELNDAGGIVSFYDKQQQREVVAAGEVGNLFQLFDDHPLFWDAWDVDAYYEEVCTNLTDPAQITIEEAGPLRGTLRVERQLTATSSLVQYIRLEANTRRVDFETQIDWQEEHKLLKVAFPVDVHSTRATYEIQYGHVERPTHRNTSWDIARFEVCAHKWADLSESDYGVALLNNGKYGHDIHGNVMRLTLLRAPKHPDPQADMGRHQFTYSLLPHRGDAVNSGVPLAGYDLNVPLYARPLPIQRGVLAQAHSYFRVNQPNIIVESIKRAEDGDGLIVRLYEAFHRRGTARLLTNGLCKHATRTDLLERDQEEIDVNGGCIELPYRPFEIITLRLR